MFLGYNTNGFAHHRLEDTIEILADLGYQGIGLTLDWNTIHFSEGNWYDRAAKIQEWLNQHHMKVVIETGARFLLDMRRKHQPTLLTSSVEERLQRFDFLDTCSRLGRILRAEAISFWSGTALDETSHSELCQRLATSCRTLCDAPKGFESRWAFEPEPGMFIDTMDKFAELHKSVDRRNFGLTLDLGHLHCQGEFPIREHLLRWKNQLWNIHIEDMKQGVHDHLMFGEGEINFAEIFETLHEIDYQGGIFVELSRHSHNAVEVARKAMAFLKPYLR